MFGQGIVSSGEAGNRLSTSRAKFSLALELLRFISPKPGMNSSPASVKVGNNRGGLAKITNTFRLLCYYDEELIFLNTSKSVKALRISIASERVAAFE